MAILPIVTYNDPILKKEADPVKEMTDELGMLITDMFQTMYNSKGVGLAAPQIGKSIRLFVIDADTMTEDLEDEEDKGPMVFINPEILTKKGEKVRLEEGCLSIPDVRDEITRFDEIIIRYHDRNFDEHTDSYSGWLSRIIQHEVDHLNGILFLDHLSPFRRRIHKFTLKKIDAGKLETEYPIVPKKQVG
ncbi:MAG: peptide deformylase [Balneolaceae bacterium]